MQNYKEKEYLPITGLADFVQPALSLAYGEASAPLKEGRVSLFRGVLMPMADKDGLDRSNAISVWYRCVTDRRCLFATFLRPK